MTNPTITLTRFKQAHKAQAKHDYCELPVFGDLSLEDAMEGLIQMQRETAGQPHLWSFSDYKATHRKEGITATTAIPLEYSIASEDEVRAAVKNLAWACYIIETENKTGNTITVVFPLVQPITDAKDYSRLASILAVGIGAPRLAQGCGAITYLIQPRPFAKVEYHDGIMVDAAERITAYQGEWIEIEKFEADRVLAGGTRAVQRAAIQAAQLDPPTHTNSDLFDWS